MKKTDTLTELLDQHAELAAESQPMLTEINERAKRALELQVKIFATRFAAEMPEARRIDGVLLATLSAREKPSKFDHLIAALTAKGVAPAYVIFDEMNYSFHLYGKAAQ
ncbi:MAG: hypothetical protein WCS42_08680 [Verrucomicrobiota bacterium]